MPRIRIVKRWAILLFISAGTGLGIPSPGIAAVTVASSQNPAGLLQAEPGDIQINRGEQLSPDARGPGVIETMEIALERDANRPPDKRSKGKAAGVWSVPTRNSTYHPHSGKHYITNKHGDPRMGIGFPGLVEVNRVYIAGQAGEGVWAPAVRVVGFRAGKRVGATPWFDKIGETPRLFVINLKGVDRIEIKSLAAFKGAAWYALDDFEYTPESREGEESKSIVLDFEDCNYRQQLTGTDYAGLTWEKGAGVFVENQDEAIHPPLTPPDLPVEPNGRDNEVASPTQGAGTATPPTLIQEFSGAIRGQAGSFSFPPDTIAGVGPNHIVETVNRILSVFDKNTGQSLLSMNLGSFLPGSNGDPRVLYDQYSNRWVVIVSDFDTRLYLAVSMTSDPTGSWFKTSFVVSQGTDSGLWPDYETLGVNADGIFTAAYMVGGGMSIFALDKAPLIDPSPALGTVTAFRGLPWEGAIQPVHTYGLEPSEFLVSRSGFNSIRVRRIDGPMTAPTLVEAGFVSIPSHSSPPDAPALGSASPISSVGHRLMNAVYRNGSIWTAHCIGLFGRAAVGWYQIDSSAATLIQSGTISDPILYFLFPSISVDEQENTVLGFTGTHAGQYPAAYYSGRAASDPPGVTAPPVMYQSGNAAQNNIDSFGRNRWGDYSQTALDPDGISLWTIQEYAEAEDVWGTHLAKLQLFPLPFNDTCATAVVTSIGLTPFSNANATPSGMAEPCGTFSSDVWFFFITQSGCPLTLSVCDADFDAELALYNFVCPSGPDQSLACSQNDCGAGPSISMTIDPGFYRVRISGFAGAQGSGTLNIQCAPPPACLGDITPPGGNGAVNIDDLVALLSAFGACPAPPAACPADITPPGSPVGNGVVNIDDLVALLSAFGPCP